LHVWQNWVGPGGVTTRHARKTIKEGRKKKSDLKDKTESYKKKKTRETTAGREKSDVKEPSKGSSAEDVSSSG